MLTLTISLVYTLCQFDITAIIFNTARLPLITREYIQKLCHVVSILNQRITPRLYSNQKELTNERSGYIGNMCYCHTASTLHIALNVKATVGFAQG